MTKKSLTLFVFILLVFAGAAFANKTSVAVEAPNSVAAGTEVTIVINVMHKGNNAFHHTKWVTVKADGEEIANWEFSGSKKPENENFSREVKYTVTKPVEITAQGSCNIHGSQGPVTVKIDVK
jgi:desulfoferrodoxin (superoxide reductase-like protein)